MKVADVVRVDISEQEAVCGFEGGVTPRGVKEFVSDNTYLKWEKRVNAKTGKEKHYLILENPYIIGDDSVSQEYNLTRIQALCNCFLENGVVLFFKAEGEENYTSDYERYVRK